MRDRKARADQPVRGNRTFSLARTYTHRGREKRKRKSFPHISRYTRTHRAARSRIKAARNAWFSHAKQRTERSEGVQEGERKAKKKRWSRSFLAVCTRGAFREATFEATRRLHTHVTTSFIHLFLPHFSSVLPPTCTLLLSLSLSLSLFLVSTPHVAVKAVTVKGDCSVYIPRVFPRAHLIPRIDPSLLFFVSSSLYSSS